MDLLRRIIREPLFHFLVIGAGLFVTYSLANPNSSAPPDTLIVSQSQQRMLETQFEGVWKRPPTSDELDALVQDYLREEVLYREALALGLDQNDTIIRRRLRQKMEFFAESGAALLEPTDADLSELLKASSERYLRPATIAFQQVFLGEEISSDEADTILATLDEAGQSDAFLELGHRTLLPAAMPATPAPGIERVFGPDFALSLTNVEPGKWQGPVKSAYGMHFVRVASRTPEELPQIDMVRVQLERDWQHAKAKEIKDLQVNALLSQYSVEIEEDISK